MYTFLYAGFVNCGQACPLTLSKLKRTMELWGEKSSANRVQTLFLNLEPIRTKEKREELLRAIGSYGEDFVGLYSPSKEELMHFAGKIDSRADFINFNPEIHTDYIYFIDLNGKLIRIYPDREINARTLFEEIRKITEARDKTIQ